MSEEKLKKINIYSFNEECYVSLNDYSKLQQENAKYKEKFDSMDNSRKILYKIALPLKLTSEKIDNMPAYFELYEENQKLKQWDVNKDTRNSRQRVENAKLIKENTQLQQQLKDKDEKIEWHLDYNKECSRQLLIEDEKIRKCIEIIKNDTTLNPQRQRDRLINILETNKED